MKIVAINSSPRGRASNTNVMVEAFLKGARMAKAETVSIFLSEKEIKHCKGCHACWTRGPGQCVTDDDMPGVLLQMAGADIIVFASPVYFGNISGMLKVFMDRMTMIGSPHSQKSSGEKRQESEPKEAQAPGLIMMANCGFPDVSEFDVVSLWIKKVCRKVHMDLAAEIYAAQGKFLSSPPEELEPAIADYLLAVESAGREIAAGMKISDAAGKKLVQNLTLLTTSTK